FLCCIPISEALGHFNGTSVGFILDKMPNPATAGGGEQPRLSFRKPAGASEKLQHLLGVRGGEPIGFGHGSLPISMARTTLSKPSQLPGLTVPVCGLFTSHNPS